MDYDFLFEDGELAYTTAFIELKAKQGSVALATPRFLDGSPVMDHETAMKVVKFITNCESLPVNDFSKAKIPVSF